MTFPADAVHMRVPDLSGNLFEMLNLQAIFRRKEWDLYEAS